MKIACLSGKGGAGKTLVAVNLAVATGTATYIDCDVEEPNGRLFLKPQQVQTEAVCTMLPDFDAQKCTGCRQCVQFCRFHALMYIKDLPMVFPEVCHSCGGCAMVCPAQAISEKPRAIGQLELGSRGGMRVVTGVLNPGEATGVPIIREALRHAEGTTIIDCPPGSACAVMECVIAADYCALVVEPTAFGFHNFRMVYELVTLMGKPCGVIVNKQDAPYEPLEAFCAAQGLPILARIPYDPALAAMAAEGVIVAEESDAMRAVFRDLLDRIGGAP